jgi:peptidoglycan/xylan/chitin deacetylase (PgdA/CDA1 family)
MTASQMQPPHLLWPNSKRIAVYVTAMLEVWSEGKAPTYTVQTTHLRPGAVDYGGIAWSRYGGQVGVWRILRALEHFGIRGTFATNAMIAEIFPNAVAEIVRAGHDIAGHGIWQDQQINDMLPPKQHETIRRTLDMLQQATGKRPEGWLSQVLAWTPEMPEFLAEEGVRWWGDAKDIDLPRKIKTRHGQIVAIPVCEFTDNRVLHGSPRDFLDVYRDTFDYLYRHEPMSVLNIILHCQWGGRPPIMAVFRQILEYIFGFPDVWFTTPGEIATWFAAQERDEISYAERYFQLAAGRAGT